MRLARCAVAILVLALGACAGASKPTSATSAAPAAIATGTGTATVSWAPPKATALGGPLTNLAGFKIYYGLDPTQLDTVVIINDPSVTSTEIERLGPGTWYFSATAIDSSGLESALSNVGSKTIS
jgi:hypothetical protein